MNFNTKELFDCRLELIKNSLDEDQVFTTSNFLSTILPDLVETRLINSEEVEMLLYKNNINDKEVQCDAWILNDTGERLQIFLLNHDALNLSLTEEECIVSKKEEYKKYFDKGLRFIKNAVNRYITDSQDSDPTTILINKLGTSAFIHQIDVIEFFLITPTVTASLRGKSISQKKIEFQNSKYSCSYTFKKEKKKKDIDCIYSVIDLNFLYDISIAKGGDYGLSIDLPEFFGKSLEVFKAAESNDFTSYLCALPASGLVELYRKYSTRLLEKNVRSFLQFRGVNKGMRSTIKDEPEKFIAYNNGLTITATDCVEESENGKLYLTKLDDLQIVNGGQTTASIYFSAKENCDVSKINLMAKINVIKNIGEDELDQLISNISNYSNSQTKVSKVDLRSRDPRIDRIKKLSEAIVARNGNKWYFEKSRGEFATSKRLDKNIEKKFPKNLRLTKTEIGKYHTAWGDQPWLVKKGGERVFRSFLEKISNYNIEEIDRLFYENLIAKTILFRELEIMHGTRKNAIGQLRAAVIPYSLSVLFNLFGGSNKRESKFDLSKIWIKQALEDDLKTYLLDLMHEMYKWIEQYKTSTDISENTKKEPLWKAIKDSKEVKAFKKTENSLKILEKYTLKKVTKPKKHEQVDFTLLSQFVKFRSFTKDFYRSLQRSILAYNQENNNTIPFKSDQFERHIDLIFNDNNKVNTWSKDNSLIKIEYIENINNFIISIRNNHPTLLDQIVNSYQIDHSVIDTLNEITKIYTQCVSDGKSINLGFDLHIAKAESMKIKYAGSAMTEIYKSLEKGQMFNYKTLVNATKYFIQKKKTVELV